MALYQLMYNKTHSVSIKIGKPVLATETCQDAGSECCRRVGAGNGRGAVTVAASHAVEMLERQGA